MQYVDCVWILLQTRLTEKNQLLKLQYKLSEYMMILTTY